MYPFLFLVGLAAGLVDAIAGGGGVISLPVLLNLGYPVPLALGTNKLQASFGSVAATVHYARAGLIETSMVRLGVPPTLVGAAAGAVCVQYIDGRLLAQTVPWLLGAIVVYTLFRPTIGEHDHPAKMRMNVFFIALGGVLGFYDGFFGPGTGSFWTIALVAVQGFSFLRATACTKLMNATSNVTGLAFFLYGGNVDFAAGAAMGAGQVVGARLGTGLAFKRGARFIRPIFMAMVVLTVVRLVYVAMTQPS